ncbi:MAG: hypothetical protein JW797_12255 [Bradymonadales bacterium]|nr:hypothetical protein [Bradymonadales bacterium]
MKRIAVLCAHPTLDTPPLGLGMCLANARRQLDERLFDLGPRFASDRNELTASLSGVAVNVLLCSDNVLGQELNLELSRLAKALDPDCITIHGGPGVPARPAACEAFLRAHPEVDFAVRGEGEIALVELLQAIQRGTARTDEIAGVSAMVGDRFVRHPDRPPIQELGQLPSAYTSGIFDGLDAERWRYAAVETNRDCPYRCAFCSWQYFSRGRVRTFPLDRVRAELEWVADHQILSLFMADSNFGLLERDVEIAQLICQVKRERSWPRLVMVEYAKRPVERLARIAEIFAASELAHGGAVSIQTRDPHTLSVVGRQNISTEDYDLLEQRFVQLGLDAHTFLMLGLPGATVASFKRDLAHYFDRPSVVLIFRTMLLPNSPMAAPEFISQHGIEVDGEGFVAATATLTRGGMAEMLRLACLFDAVHNNGILRVPLRWLQWDRGIDPIELMHELARDPELTQRIPQLGIVLDGARQAIIGRSEVLARLPRNRQAWIDLNERFATWLEDHHNIEKDQVLRTVLEAQTAVMPADELRYPLSIRLDHDLVAWYRERLEGGHRPLQAFGPGSLEVDHPASRGFSWELQSALRRW